MGNLEWRYRIFLMAALVLLPMLNAAAQSFKVDKFRMLENDVTSFVNPVRDLNGDACALIKVPASSDFVFSTPLGIVKRVDNVGEIWLYVPNGTVRLTIKHPEWGVLRDYKLPSKLESHVAYELQLDTPLSRQASASPEIQIVRDTLVVTHTDTIVTTQKMERIPLSAGVLAEVAFGGSAKTLMGGLRLYLMRSHGGYLNIVSDFGHIGKTQGVCDKDGYVGSTLPYYTGKTRHSALIATAGAIHRISSVVNVFEGIGYGYDNTGWELADPSAGRWVKNSHWSHDGIAFELGTMVNVKRLSFTASVISIGGTQWYGSVGIGVRIR